MQTISAPLQPGDQNDAVANLQDALLALLDRGAAPAGIRDEFSKALRPERAGAHYGPATARLVTLFQEGRRMPATGAVDEATAQAINGLLLQQGIVKPAAQQPATPDEPATSAHPAESANIPAETLHQDETTAQGDSAAVIGGILKPGDLGRPSDGGKPYQVSGVVASRASAGVGGLRVVIVDKGVGGDQALTETQTATDGSYHASFTDQLVARRGKTQPDLQARVFHDKAFVGASSVRYNASPVETINVWLSDATVSALASEHETLTTALAGQYTGALRDLKENPQQQDVTFLANKTGWDARAVAMAALADQFSARMAESGARQAVPPAVFYALFRAGLGANEGTLYHTPPETVANAIQSAASQGIIPSALCDQIPQITRSFQEMSARQLLSAPTVIGASALKDLLDVSHLDQNQQTRFAQLYTENRGNLAGFWKAVENDQAFGATPEDRQAAASRLQLDGKLAFLTVNNAPLVQALHRLGDGRAGLNDPVQLAQMGYADPAAWAKLLTAEVPIPKEIPGNTPEARRSNYAGLLAATVRLSYPTACIAQMVKTGALPLGDKAQGVAGEVSTFLDAQQGQFELGAQPVESYLAANPQVQAPSAEVLKQIKRIQRVYQMTESDQAMTGLMQRKLDAAYHVMRFDKATFVQSFANDVGGPAAADRIFERAAQIHNATLNVILGFINSRTAPAIGVHSPPAVVNPAPANASDVVAYAKLESLFGSLDFCDCDECRSILSPAAYLVDLLLFLQSDPDIWQAYATAWHANHGNAPYPFLSQADFNTFQANWNAQHPGQPLPNTEISPFDVLISRRPDLQYLPLTCENTNTALPYIDVVNETLEYYIANNVQQLSLQGYTGYDTGNVTSEDLLASPQNVIDAAYTTLKSTRFPAPLPFHKPLESLRRYENKLGTPLAQTLEALRQSDALERNAQVYGWRDILMEQLGFSRAEYELLTGSPNPVTLWQMYGFPNGTTDAQAIAGLSNGSQYAKRMHITYDDLVALLKTRFINPAGDLLPRFERLGATFSQLKAYHDGALTDNQFDQIVAAQAVPPDPAEYGDNIKKWAKDHYDDLIGLVVLIIPASAWSANTAYHLGDCVLPTAGSDGLYYVCTQAGNSAAAQPQWPAVTGTTITDGGVKWITHSVGSCDSFDDLAFRYADPAKSTQLVDGIVFVRLLRFIRLWKKLGWTVDQTGEAVDALLRADFQPLTAADVGDVNALNTGFMRLLPRLGVVSKALQALNLKLNRDLLALLALWSPLSTHSDGALYRRMFLNPAVLKQDPVFDDHGYGAFLSDPNPKLADHAEALRSAFNLTGDEFTRITTHLGYDANTLLSLANVSAIFRRGWLARALKISVVELLLFADLTGLDPFDLSDVTQPGVLKLNKLLHDLKARSLKTEAALYLIWNQDLSGKSAPTAEQISALARLLRADFNAVDDAFAATSSPDDAAAARLTLVYGQATSDAFFALLDDTQVVDTPYTQAAATLDAALTAADAKIAYDPFRHLLAHTGLLTAAQQAALKGAAAATQAFKDAVDALYNQGQTLSGLFFTRYPELKDAFNLAHAAAPDSRHATFLNAFQPVLAQKRKRQQAIQRLSVTAGVDQAFTQTLLDSPAAPYPLHAKGAPARPVLDDVIALQTQGLRADFYFRATATGAVDLSMPAETILSYTQGGSHPLPNPGNPVSGVWQGALEAPESGYFNFIIEADSGAAITLTLDGQNQPLTQNGAVWRNTNPIQFQAEQLVALALKIENVQQAIALTWETPTLSRQPIAPRYLYPSDLLAPFSELYMRFLKACALAAALKLTPAEIAALATHADFSVSGDGWLNALPSAAPIANPETLLTPLQGALDFARLKADLSPDDNALLTAWQNPAAATQTDSSLLYRLTRWTPADLTAILAQFNLAVADLNHLAQLARVYDALNLAQQMGISAAAFIAAATNEPTPAQVTDLQAALRARYDPSSWRDVVKPINDELRALQRDALVAYILHQMKLYPESATIDTPEKLFEYFLMDVQMEPIMQTSRIRHALSTVQLFIERCLMNLEPRVSPQAINADQWEWMKRYRVWEANRKVYLYPENWLEPELRDNKSPFFKEVESELLQNDITEDSATTAYLNYLEKLEEVAKLEVCGFYHIPPDPALRTGDICHVVARTAGAKRKYFYRRYEYGYWTPWEQIKLDIEDNPVVPVIWNDRLLLFWLRILHKTVDNPNSGLPTGASLTGLTTDTFRSAAPYAAFNAVLCWSEYYNGKWQPTKTSDVDRPTHLGDYPTMGIGAFDRSDLILRAFEENDGLRIYIISSAGSFLMYNTHSLPVRQEDSPAPGQAMPNADRLYYGDNYDSLAFDYEKTGAQDIERDILQPHLSFRIIRQRGWMDGWDDPFFVEATRHVFYVTTQEERVWIPNYIGYGYIPSLPKQAIPRVPPIYKQVDPSIPTKPDPRPWENPIEKVTEPGILTQNLASKYVTEDAYINKNIAAADTVTFDQAKVGPAGSNFNAQAGR